MAGQRKDAVVSRDVHGTAIPYGDPVTLHQGDVVVITQSLGGSFTLLTAFGYMVRLDGKDADAIGETISTGISAEDIAGKPLGELAWDQLRTCYDPEIPVNIVELGLVYECSVDDLPDGSGKKATVKFTLTAPGCGMGDVLRQDIDRKMRDLPGVTEVDAQIVLDPPWDQSRMSDVARLQLGMM